MTVLGEIEGQIREVRRKAQELKRREVEHEKAFGKAVGDGEGKGKLGKRGGLGEDGEDEMDLDDGGKGRLRGAKRGGGNFLGGFGRRLGGGHGG